MSSNADVKFVTWGVLISLITIGSIMVLGILFSNPTELILHLTIAIFAIAGLIALFVIMKKTIISN